MKVKTLVIKEECVKMVPSPMPSVLSSFRSLRKTIHRFGENMTIYYCSIKDKEHSKSVNGEIMLTYCGENSEGVHKRA